MGAMAPPSWYSGHLPLQAGGVTPSLLSLAGFQCRLIPLFDPQFSPRNLVLVAAKAQSASALSTLVEDNSKG